MTLCLLYSTRSVSFVQYKEAEGYRHVLIMNPDTKSSREVKSLCTIIYKQRTYNSTTGTGILVLPEYKGLDIIEQHSLIIQAGKDRKATE